MADRLKLKGRPLEELQEELRLLKGERDKADAEGKDELERKIGRLERYVGKKTEEKAKASAPPPPMPPLTLPQLLSEAAAVQKGITEHVAKLGSSFSGEPIKVGPLTFSPLTQFCFSIWVVFQMRNLTADKVEAWGPWIALAGMAGSAINDNKELIFGKPTESGAGDGAERERKDNAYPQPASARPAD